MPLMLFTLTILTSAFLLFWIQPLSAQLLLPLYGGAPSVWNTSMMFYQGVLLLGYGYVHLLSKLRHPLQLWTLHLCVLGLSLLALPSLVSTFTTPDPYQPITSLLLNLSTHFGLPFFILSTSTPLLQYWLSHGSHQHSEDPYFLFSTANFGSLLALFSFPILLQPTLHLSLQQQLWAEFFILYAALLIAIVLYTQVPSLNNVSPRKQNKTISLVKYSKRIRWIALAFAPSSLLLGVTTHITTDITSAPLLWLLPFLLYLITYIFAFSKKTIIPRLWVILAQPFLILPAVILLMDPQSFGHVWQMLGVHLLSFFACALVCHNELAFSRPHKQHLTEYYLWIAFGGFLGGVFNALIAPHLFNTILEYPLALSLCCFLRPNLGIENPWRWQHLLWPLGIAIIAILARYGIGEHQLTVASLSDLRKPYTLIMYLLVVLTISFPDYPLRFSLSILALLLITHTPAQVQDTTTLHSKRNFFGTWRVYELPTSKMHILMSGTTVHGAQDFSVPRHPLRGFTYYDVVSEILSPLLEKNRALNVGIVGLGTGTIACYARPSDHYTYYELDPDIIKIAQNPLLFTYLHDCPVKEIIVGDARLRLQEAPSHHYQLMILDAFSSDAIPSHLLTQEALELYLAKLAPKGMIAFHISNRYIDLAPVLARLAQKLNLPAMIYRSRGGQKGDFIMPSTWVVMAKNPHVFGKLSTNLNWHPLPVDESGSVWIDGRVDLWSVLF